MSHGVLSATFSITRPGSKRSAIWCWHLSLGNCHNRTFHPGNSVLGWAEGREGQNGCIHQESGSLKQKHFVCLDDLSKVPQVHFQLLDIGDQLIDYAGPSLSTKRRRAALTHPQPHHELLTSPPTIPRALLSTRCVPEPPITLLPRARGLQSSRGLRVEQQTALPVFRQLNTACYPLAG